jgi:hypothetical protein
MATRTSRRSFLQSSCRAAAVVTASGSLAALRAAGPVHQGGGTMRIGVVGIGGRGSGATVQALRAHKKR